MLRASASTQTLAPASIAGLTGDAGWLAHRYDPEHDAVPFPADPRATHRTATFLPNDHLPNGPDAVVLSRASVMAAAPSAAPIHFIFHSAFCCSTLLARAFDIEGVAMGLKEPMILNDIVGWRRRGGKGPDLAEVLDNVLTLLARPFVPGERIIVKPANVVQGIAAAMLMLRPEAHALLLYAPLRTFLGSVAKKGLDGRLWVRTLLLGLIDDKLIELGFDLRDYLGQTDLQIAAVGWLAQQALFADLIAQFGESRIRTLDSATLNADPSAVMKRLSRLFGLGLNPCAIDASVSGTAFTNHSKTGVRFSSADREQEDRAAAALHADEIEKVALWAEAVAQKLGVALVSPASLMVNSRRWKR